MATTAQINTQTIDNSFFWVYWHQEGSQDVAGNKTNIYWSCGVTCGHSYYSNAIKMSEVYINGVLVYGGGTYSNFGKGEHRIAYGFMDIPHNADGTKTFNISSFTGWLYSNNNYSAAATSHTLTQIPRKATITSVSDFTDLDNPSFTFSNPGGFSMDVWLEPNPVGDHLCVHNGIPNTGSYTWVLTEEERDQLRSKCSGTECTIRVGLYTHIGDTVDADYKDKKFTMTENAATKPTVGVTASLNNGSLPDKFSGIYIQGKSRVDIKVTATGQYGASINSYSAVVEGKTYKTDDFTSDVITGSGEVVIAGYAVDSRGFTGTGVADVNVIPYSKPLVVPIDGENSILCYRSDESGKRTGNSESLWLKAKMSFYDVDGENTCALQWRWKPASNIWDDATHKWADLIPNTTSTDEYNALIPGEFEKKKAYTVQIRAIDDIGEYDIKTFEIPTQDVALHLGKGGKNVSVGTYCTYNDDYTFYSGWKAIFDKEVVIGDQAEFIGDVIIGGKAVKNHVIEEGTDGIWKYRKWADGTAECRGIYTQDNVLIDTAWGNLYESASYWVDLPSGLFVETPQFSITLTGSRGSMLEAFSEGSATETPHMCAIRPSVTKIETLNTSIVCYGRWKEEE